MFSPVERQNIFIGIAEIHLFYKYFFAFCIKIKYISKMSNLFFDWLNSTHIAFQSVELSKAFLIFLMFSLIGWLCEVAYVGIFFEHKFVNRGFLFGPICPVYGVGGILILSLPHQFQNPVWVLYIVGVFFCSAVEYAAGFGLERIFHTKWWDYSNEVITIKGRTIPLNINGRVCLKNSLLFGFLTVVVIKFVQPLIERLWSYFSETVIITASNVLLVGFLIDIIFSVSKLVDFSVHIAKLKELGESLKDRYQNESWFKGGSISEMFESIKERSQSEKEKFSAALLEKIESANKRSRIFESFVKRFPTMKSALYKDSIIHLRGRKKAFAEKK